MSQRKSSDFDMHCRLVAERLGKPLSEVKEIVNHYYGGVLKLTSARMGTMFMLPELGQLRFNSRNVDYPIRRLEKKVFYYANVYMHKTKITSYKQQQMFKSRVKLRAVMTNYVRSYVYFICCMLKVFTDKYYNFEHRDWHKTFGNYEKAPFNLAAVLGNLLRLEQILSVPITIEFFKESDRLTKKALRYMFHENLLGRFKALEEPYSFYRDMREMWLCVTSENSQPNQQMSA
jgi:hypothetical protein